VCELFRSSDVRDVATRHGHKLILGFVQRVPFECWGWTPSDGQESYSWIVVESM
jgi:hypothetical protein